ncbi:MAG: ATP-binding cassette domain-containing protein, partial [Terriglobales bacterium]
MPPILNAQGLTKAFGAFPLFQEISFTVSEGDRIGLIGPNGAGKSTLLQILAGQMDADRGEVAIRKRARLLYVLQDSKFVAGLTVRSVIEAALRRSGLSESERGTISAETLGRAAFEDLDMEAAALSGGWRKRLALVEALVQAPDV